MEQGSFKQKEEVEERILMHSGRGSHANLKKKNEMKSYTFQL